MVERKGLTLGERYKDWCYACEQLTEHKLIAFNRIDNPVYECLSCGNLLYDPMNKQNDEVFTYVEH